MYSNEFAYVCNIYEYMEFTFGRIIRIYETQYKSLNNTLLAKMPHKMLKIEGKKYIGAY